MPNAPMLIAAGLSARMMAESAAQAGLPVIALDVFGDADTRHAACHWEPLGGPDALSIDPERLLAALRRLRASHPLLGWIAGGGFEHQPGLIEAAHAIVPLLGNGAATVRTVKQPASFFRLLDALGIAHPPTRLNPPPCGEGWLSKRVGGTGGWHIRPLYQASASASAGEAQYYQQRVAGQSMSALFLANGSEARMVGVSRQHTAGEIGACGSADVPDEATSFLFCGASGPTALKPATASRLGEIVHAIVRETGLVGLNSIDFLLDADEIAVLEINPRLSATMALYADAFAGGLVQAHLQACRGILPPPLPAPLPAAGTSPLRGFHTVFAARAAHIGTALAADLMRTGWCHDIPPPGTAVDRGNPICTVFAEAATAGSLAILLQQRHAQIHHRLEAHHAQHHARHQERRGSPQPQRQFA
ncbi:ATP-grasp domain-containing protein [Cupriavidus sp. IK-TO18]|uniref:ATP-grasp domain-containing protein n=1 Tax=Cupriavidus sp. IK-TO18 TaxID=2782182 RepID=UPI00189A0598|nr:ATP-grasp domain-containing protein [Cupriavidus sp. IK-TO18]MBF6989189.1 ATP-grasp domain-containing protein [Cupriavidus sp. IK-TO18]